MRREKKEKKQRSGAGRDAEQRMVVMDLSGVSECATLIGQWKTAEKDRIIQLVMRRIIKHVPKQE